MLSLYSVMDRIYGAEVSSSCSSFQCPYDVFLSFRGEDTRTNFTDHLYAALIEAKVHVFKDDDGIERGKNVKSELERAIRQSRIAIVVFSKNYASSIWCLDELLRILHQKKTAGQQVFPVLYDVSPSEVRNQTGNFEKAFEEHELTFKQEIGENQKRGFDRMQQWRAALKEAADIGGFVLENHANRHEARFIRDHIIPDVLQRISPRVLSEPLHLVGIDNHVREITSWLQDGSSEVGILAIYGMGGTGKTTIAKVTYNLNYTTFDGSSFLEDIREISRKFNGLILVQKHLLSKVFKGRSLDIDNIDHGITLITKALCCTRALLVLDDIDEEDQLDAILRQYHRFCPGSKIIITTRNPSLLRAYSVSQLHAVEVLEDTESLELFSLHAFKQNQPVEGYMELSKRAIKYCEGLPLSLQVLGSSLCHTNLDIWKSALEKFEAIPDRKTIEKLRLSYECLPDDSQKNLFLDISCFFVGKDKDYVGKILEKCNLFPAYGFQMLMDRCLLTIDTKNKLKMHRLLRDMGREIVRQESTDNPGERSRIWQYQDSFDVLKVGTGTIKIQGLSLDLRFLNKETVHGVGIKSKSCALKCDTFASMRRLRLLQLNYVHLMGSFKVMSKEIRWLCWHGFPKKCLPDDFNCEKVVAVDMQYSRLKHAWKGMKFLGCLKFLNLSHSSRLVNTPNFNGVPNLERITIKFCTSLIEVHESIVKLKRLLVLNLKGCKSLRKLPAQFHQLKSLRKLIISGCSKLSNLPEELDNMISLEVLDADGICQSLPCTQEHGMWHIFLPKLRRSPAFTCPSLPQSLTVLRISQSNISDHALPKNLGSLSALSLLDLSHNPIQMLPDSIKQLQKLRHLDVTGCNNLLTVPELPNNLCSIFIANCKSLEKLTNIPNLFQGGIFLIIHGCPKLVEVEKMFTLQPIEKFGLEMMQSFGLEDIEPVKSIKVKLLNMMTGEANYFPVQGLMEFGIFSIFLPGNKIPDWFSRYRNVRFSIKKDSLFENVSTLSFAMPSLPNFKFRGLNIGAVYSCGEQGGIYHLVSNRTKDIGWLYSPTFSVAANDEDVIFLSHWDLENLFEDGDILDIRMSGLTLKKIEILLIYDQEDVQNKHCTACISLANRMENGSLSSYEFSHGRHFLCHYHYKAFLSPEKIVWRVFVVMNFMDLFHNVPHCRSVLHQLLLRSSALQDSQHFTFRPATMLGRADLPQSFILRLVYPLFVATDYHLRRSTSPISCAVAELIALFKWLIDCPDFVPDSNFIDVCQTIAMAEVTFMQQRFDRNDIDKIVRETLSKSRGASQVRDHLAVVDKNVENINLPAEDGANKVDVLMAFGTYGLGKTIIARFVFNITTGPFLEIWRPSTKDFREAEFSLSNAAD